MKVLTLNTWQERGPWRKRWEIIFEGLNVLKPDVVFFQEIFNPDWIHEISRRAPYPTAVYHDPASGLALFSNYPCLESGSKMLKDQSPLEDYRRYLLFAKFQTETGVFFAFNTHLSWMLEDGKVREQQTREIASSVKALTGSCESLIAGDFNAVAWSPEIRGLTQAQGFSDLYVRLNPEQPGLTWTYDNFYTREGRHALPDRRIDFVFSHQARVLLDRPKLSRVVLNQPDTRGILASDHYGVFAEFDPPCSERQP